MAFDLVVAKGIMFFTGTQGLFFMNSRYVCIKEALFVSNEAVLVLFTIMVTGTKIAATGLLTPLSEGGAGGATARASCTQGQSGKPPSQNFDDSPSAKEYGRRLRTDHADTSTRRACLSIARVKIRRRP